MPHTDAPFMTAVAPFSKVHFPCATSADMSTEQVHVPIPPSWAVCFGMLGAA